MVHQQIYHYEVEDQPEHGMLFKIPAEVYLSEDLNLSEEHPLTQKDTKGVYFVPCLIDADPDADPLMFVINGVNNEITVTPIMTLIQLTVETYRNLSDEIEAYQYIKWLPAYAYYPDPERVDFYKQGLFEELILKIFPLKEGVQYEPVLPLGYLRPLDMNNDIEDLSHVVETLCVFLRKADCEFIKDGVS